jgi:hypothetical protein
MTMLDPAIQKTFDQQRFERLKEVVAEYLDDEGGTTSKLLQDLQRAALENSQYFVGRVDEYTELQDFFS